MDDVFKYLIEHDYNPNQIKQNGRHVMSLPYICQIIEVIDTILSYELSQVTLQVLYYRLIREPKSAEYVTIIYNQIESFEVDDFNLNDKGRIHGNCLSNFLHKSTTLRQILDKLKPSTKPLKLEFFSCPQDLEMVLDHFSYLDLVEDLNQYYLKFLHHVLGGYYDTELLKRFKLLTNYGAKPKLDMTYDEAVKKLRNSGILSELAKRISLFNMISDDIEFKG